ncbi:hydroxymethylbilane synthase [Niabella yanshanensis]|uniref:Hydroxymethylbilane synthase n=1 Tax=Niabella yanshanensis TaxID=577386 RepID=A0ABZ0W2F4_9BACT|nr:hydroxymethylbilane synthase [Niabella yanshanensis]WQD37386.1 hydroxymethylbilane synthase [Niabella yanshanensis]
MQNNPIRIGTRESQLAVWQADLVKKLLEDNGHAAELVFIKSEGDIDLVTPLYAMGVQGVFTRALDAALLNNRIDIAVHSMKDVPVQLPQGIVQAAVLERASYKDILVYREQFTEDSITQINHGLLSTDNQQLSSLLIGTSSIRRKAQWLNRYPGTVIENLRGNINTRLKKVAESQWHGAIFAAAGLERINVRPENSIDLDWMLPAPAQGAIMAVARDGDYNILEAFAPINHNDTAIAVKIERDFLSALMGGCSTPISALAEVTPQGILFKGNIISPDGSQKVAVERTFSKAEADNAGTLAGHDVLEQGGREIVTAFKNAK